MVEPYHEIRNATEQICSKLQAEEHIIQPADFVSPPKWHLGHTTWFFETFILKPNLKEYREFHPDYNFLFNSYYETVGERVQRNHRGMLFRPPVSEIYAYRKHVDQAMNQLLQGKLPDEIQQLITLGLQHEQQHQELLLTDTKYIFAQNPLFPVWDETKTLSAYRQKETYSWLPIEEGIYDIGFDGTGFCFDNELGRHKQYIHAAALMDRPITNGEYLKFINSGGYSNFRYWLSEGWEWVKANKAVAPMYWHKVADEWYFYHWDGLKKLDPSLPVMHINYYEADAFANWKKMRLPTEFEWEVAARQNAECFTNMVWEWTQSAYLPYKGFKVAGGAIGEYNGKFMISQMVLRGGSIATSPGHSRVSYRNFFHPHLQWQFSGIRLAMDL